MSTIAALRETLRPQLGDIAVLAKQRRFQNESLEEALFDALQQHNRDFTWNTLPREEEQLVLLLAKSRLAKDKALEYALDPKMTAGSNLGRGKESSSMLLMEISQSYREEYVDVKRMIQAQSEGDIVVGTLVRRSRTTGTEVQSQSAQRPRKPLLADAHYRFDSFLSKGFVEFHMRRPTDGNLSFIRIYIDRKPTVNFDSYRLRTIYDLYSDPIRYAQPPAPQPQPQVPQMSQENFSIDKVILPTGQWFVAVVAFTWNMLFNWSDPIPFNATAYREFTADTFGYDDETPLTSTTTTSTTSTTSTTTTS